MADDILDAVSAVLEECDALQRVGDNAAAAAKYHAVLAPDGGLALQHPRAECVARQRFGNLLASTNDYAGACAQHRLVISVARDQLKDRHLECGGLCNLGIALDGLGSAASALECHTKALALSVVLGDEAQAALAAAKGAADEPATAAASKDVFTNITERGAIYTNTGGAYKALSQPDKAMEAYRAALSILQGIGDPAGEATALSNLGTCLQHSGKTAEAKEHFEKSLALTRSLAIPNPRSEAQNLGNLGNLLLGLEEYAEAAALLEQTLAIATKIGDASMEAHSLSNLARISSAEKNEARDPAKAAHVRLPRTTQDDLPSHTSCWKCLSAQTSSLLTRVCSSLAASLNSLSFVCPRSSLSIALPRSPSPIPLPHSPSLALAHPSPSPSLAHLSLSRPPLALALGPNALAPHSRLLPRSPTNPPHSTFNKPWRSSGPWATTGRWAAPA